MITEPEMPRDLGGSMASEALDDVSGTLENYGSFAGGG